MADAAAWDAVVVGGGMAGLSAALWLARYRRRVRVYDSAEPRNEEAWAVHGYPGLVDPTPTELRRRLYEQAIGAGATQVSQKVTRVSGARDAFHIETENGDRCEARRIVLAYGLIDELPAVPGLDAYYGTSVFHCPDCDGPSVSGCRVGVIGAQRAAANLALYLQTWADEVMLLTNGTQPDLTDSALSVLATEHVQLRTERLTMVRGTGPRVSHVDTDGGEPIMLDAIFFDVGTRPRSNIADQLACAYDDHGYLQVDRGQETTVRGVHAAGDITGHPHLAVTAAADGVRAALSIHRSLLPDSRRV